MSIQKPRPTGVNLKVDTKEQMLMWYRSGHTTAEIAKAFNVNKSTVSRLTLRAGLREPLASAGNRLTEAEVVELQTMYKTTYLSKRVIAEKMGISYDTVAYHTKGMSREMPEYKKSLIAEMYLKGELSAEYFKEHEGVTKKQLYAIIREFLGIDADKEDDFFA